MKTKAVTRITRLHAAKLRGSRLNKAEDSLGPDGRSGPASLVIIKTTDSFSKARHN